MAMNLLNIIDEEYKQLKNDGGRGYDKNFYYYQNVNFKSGDSNNSFICLKQKKIKFIIVEEIDKIKLYLTDSDIIELIVKLDQDLFDMLTNSMDNLFKGIGEEFQFIINEVTYASEGLKFTKEEKSKFNKQIETKADFSINFEELVNLINLIIAKEKAAMELTIEPSFDRVKRQLAKYISLSKFYRNKDEASTSYLKEIKYDTSKSDIYLIYHNDWQQSKIDNKFNDYKVFEKLYSK